MRPINEIIVHCTATPEGRYRLLLGLELGDLVETEEWVEVEDAKRLDVVLMRERPWHVGVVVGRGLMLHMPEQRTSVIEPYTTGRHARRVTGLYRHTSQL